MEVSMTIRSKQQGSVDPHNPLLGAATARGRIAEAPGVGEAHDAIPKRVLRRDPVKLRFDQHAGWPPVLEGESRCCLERSPSQFVFDATLQRASRDVALRDAEVRSCLKGRSELLGVYLVASRDKPSNGDLRVEVCFFNYTRNQLLEVTVEGDTVTKIRIGESFQHPEAPIEMAQAIGLARAHPKIRHCVADLEAHAILSVPMDASAPNYKHRCLLVMFTEPNDRHRELPVKFSALVDLCDQAVVAFGECACGDGNSNAGQMTDKY